MVSYFESCGVDTRTAEWIDEENHVNVFCVSAKDSEFADDTLPVMLRDIRSENEFFSDEMRREEYSAYLEKCDYQGLVSYLEEYIENRQVDKNDVVEEVLETAKTILPVLSESCIVETDEFDNSTSIRYAMLDTDISEDTCIIPKMILVYSRPTVECILGFMKSDWLFFDSISVLGGEEQKNAGFNTSKIFRDVISGSVVKESVFSSGVFDSAFNAAVMCGEGKIRFENSDKQENYEHTLTSTELEALKTIYQVYGVH